MNIFSVVSRPTLAITLLDTCGKSESKCVSSDYPHRFSAPISSAVCETSGSVPSMLAQQLH